MELVNDELFARMVADDVKRKSGDFEQRYLAMPENAQRWQDALAELLINIDNQMIELDNSKQRDATMYSALGPSGLGLVVKSGEMYEDRRKKLKRFRHHVEVKLNEVTLRTAGLYDQETMLYPLFKRAIEKHREANDSPRDIDHSLYGALEGEWLFGDEQ